MVACDSFRSIVEEVENLEPRDDIHVAVHLDSRRQRFEELTSQWLAEGKHAALMIDYGFEPAEFDLSHLKQIYSADKISDHFSLENFNPLDFCATCEHDELGFDPYLIMEPAKCRTLAQIDELAPSVQK